MNDELLAVAAGIRCEYPKDPCREKKGGGFIPCDNCKARGVIEAIARRPMPDPSEFCKIMDAWAEACMTALPTDEEWTTKWRKDFQDHWRFVRLAIRKSCLLDRLMYGREKIRTEMCPVHKGHWRGCNVDAQPEGCNCRHDICITGWQQNPGDPKSGNSGMMVVTAKPDPETGHLTAVSRVDPPR